MDQLSVNEKIGPNYMLLELTGSMNAYTIGDFQEKVYKYIVDSNVVLDLSEVDSIDSQAMGTLLAAYNDGETYGFKLFFMNPSESAKHAIDKTGFTDDFYIIHSVTEVSDEH